MLRCDVWAWQVEKVFCCDCDMLQIHRDMVHGIVIFGRDMTISVRLHGNSTSCVEDENVFHDDLSFPSTYYFTIERKYAKHTFVKKYALVSFFSPLIVKIS